MTIKPNILVIAREALARTAYRQGYEAENLTVHCAEDVTDPGVEALQDRVDLVVLESCIHGGQTMDFCRRSMDRRGPPIILITDGASLPDQVLALEVGADDVLLKPADPKLLMAKSRALMRRGGAPADTAGEVRGWAVDGLRSEIHTPAGQRFRVPPVQARTHARLCSEPRSDGDARGPPPPDRTVPWRSTLHVAHGGVPAQAATKAPHRHRPDLHHARCGLCVRRSISRAVQGHSEDPADLCRPVVPRAFLGG